MLPLSSTPQARAGTIFQLLLGLLLVHSTCYAQSWEVQPLLSYGSLTDVHFVDSSTGWIVGVDSEDGIVFKTTDGGDTWVEQKSGAEKWLNPVNFNNVYFVDNLTGWVIGDLGTIIKTEDGGEAWVKQLSDIPYDLNDVHFVDNLTGWTVGEEGTILHTTDGGNTWIEQASGTNERLTNVHFADIQKGWVVGIGTIMKTEDGGETWIKQLPGTDIYLMDIHFVDNQAGWIVGRAGFGEGIILKTTDGGNTWKEQLFVTDKEFSSVHFVDSQTGWVKGSNSEQLCTILKTEDGGETWTEQISDTREWLSSLYFIDSSTGWVVGGGILKTINGGETWFPQASVANGITDVHFIDSQTGWALSGTMLKTTNGGNTWIRKYTPETLERLTGFHFVDSQTGWVVGENVDVVGNISGTILHTTDGGETWIRQISGIDKELTSVHFIDSNTGWTVGNMGAILHTTNGGDTWVQQASKVDYNLTNVYFVDSQTGWVVGERGAILHTSDGGETWTEQKSGSDIDLKDVHFVDNQSGWAVGDGGTILKTNDGGDTWIEQASRINNNLASVHFPDSLTGRVVGENGIILYTSDGGSTWIKQVSGTYQTLTDVYFTDSSTGWAVGGDIILHYISDNDTTGNGNNQQMVNEFIVQYTQDASKEEKQDFEQVLRDSGAVLVKGCNSCTTSSIQLWRSEEPIDLEERLKYARDRTDVDTLEYNYVIDFQPWEAGNVKIWEPKASRTDSWLSSVYFVDSLTGWVVGDRNTILHTSDGGETWVKQITGVDDLGLLPKVFFIDSLIGWVVGEKGTILKTINGGATWFEQTLGSTIHLNDVHFVDSLTGWVIGDFAIFKTEDGGNTWIEQLFDIDYYGLNSVYFIDSLTGWVGGGNMLKTEDGGETWVKQGIGGGGFHFVDNQKGWAMGGNAILKTEDGGETWVEQTYEIASDHYLTRLHFVDSLTGWVVGYSFSNIGIILHTIDGGETWFPQASGTDDELTDVFFINSSTGWVVGANGTILVSHQQDELVQPYAPHNVTGTVRVAVVDTGVKTDHYLLQNALGFNNADTYGTCYSEGGYGYDYVRDNFKVKDIDGHGTGVNGIIVREFPNQVKLEVMNLKFYEGGEGALFHAVCAIYHAIAVKADIINLSWGFKSESYPGILHDALAAARDADILIITSAGNTAENNDVVYKYPANIDLDNIITVTAYEENADGSKQLAPYANYGQNNVDVAAQGYLQTAGNDGETSEVSGTSMAAPLITRTAAIIMGQYPALTYQQVRDCIFSTTDALLISEGKSIKYGALNHEAALACAEEKAHGTVLVPAVQNFTLLNAALDQEVFILEQGATYSLDTLHLSSYNILADVEGEDITKVVMQLEGTQEALQTERIAPYTLFRNNGNDYFGQQPKAGDYTLTATPYYINQDSAEVVGQSLMINFSLADSSAMSNLRKAQNASKDASSGSTSVHPEKASTAFQLYPNPVSGELYLEWLEDLDEEIVISLYNLQGIAVLHTRLQVYQKHVVTIDLTHLPAATYLVKVIAKNKVSTTLIMKSDS